MNYFHINSIKEIFTKYDNLDNIIFSERLSLTEDNMNYYKDQSTYKQIVGSGDYQIKDNEVMERKSAETCNRRYAKVGRVDWVKFVPASAAE